MCLFCHQFLCLGTLCCVTRRLSDEESSHLAPHVRDRYVNAEASFHARSCGAGNAAFLLFRLSSVMLLMDDKRCLWKSIYLDDHGEEDIALRRGRPMHLSSERLESFKRMWACGTLLDEAKEWFVDGNLY